ncbi:uncharacterized protein LOC124162749 isoform X2 [Ischnura elegans]|uniref:uncharacterized protein LOC124162749 isoform X2 n=1 Tax=Ischnura elegans TaxID=197161 RepID=UPI001ED8B9A4|nr:uncharacterized protein LOC124162749 isoform X2 [Ischnura elegans]
MGRRRTRDRARRPREEDRELDRRSPPRRLASSVLFLPAAALLILFVAMLLPPQMGAQPLQTPANAGPQQHRQAKRIASQAPAARKPILDARAASLRQRRQSKPQEGLWQLYFRLMREGNNDTVNAFQQIRQLFSKLIVPDGESENLTTTEQASDDVDGGAGNETMTTTTEPAPRRISSGELMSIFRRNVFGLGRLFGREFWNAIQQSNKNIQMYSREWQDAIRPFVQ